MGKFRRGGVRAPAAPLSFELLEPRHALAANFVISEFMADNGGSLLDNYSVASDWVEIHNDGDAAGNLLDYYLTDDATEKDKWRFPSVAVPAGGYVLVFASGQDDIAPGQPLHTNFSLAKEGEYLGLVAPDGQTVVDDFGPQFPPQRSNISHGLGQIVDAVHYVSPGAAGQTLVPTSSGYDAVWRALGYVPDANWTSGTTGVGYGQTTGGFLVRTYQANIAAGSPVAPTLDTIDEVLELIGDPTAYTSTAAGNFATINYRNNYTSAGNATRYTAGQIEFPGYTTGTDYNHFATEVHARVTIPMAGAWTFGLDHNEGYLLRIGDEEFAQNGTGSTERFHTFTFAAAGTYDLDLFHFERTGSSWLKLYAAQGTFTGFNSGVFDLVGDVANGGLAVTSDVVGGTGGSISQLVGTNLQAQMLGFGTSFYTRVPFNVANPAGFDQLKLRMKYDDAFVAYLNGTEIARRNFAGSPAWNSISGPPRMGDEALVYEDINVSAFLGSLVAGPNVLAIHGMNASASDPDLLVLPELIAADVQSAGLAYFTTPTPGSANAAGFVDFAAAPQFSVDRGFYTTAQQVAVTTATQAAQIYYTTNGDAPTQATGTLYTAPINVSATTVLRAAAFRSGYLPSEVATQTYLFVNDIVQQTSAKTVQLGFPTAWGTSVPNSNFPASVFPDGAGYGLDADIVGNFDAGGNPTGGDLYGGVYAAQLKDAFQSIPTLSLVMDLDDLFSASTGIITNASQRGSAWERAASVEWIDEGALEFQVDAGIRIQGAFFRSNSNNLKKSFRLLFKEQYGPGKLDAPLFGDDPGIAAEFNTLVLRAGANDGYTWNSAKLTEQYTRDQFMRELQLASGNAGSHGNFAHLYINGVYWGLYNPVERPDNEFAASYLGGDPENWDVVHGGGGTFEAQNGDFVAWNDMLTLAQQAATSQAAYMQLQGKNLDGTPNPATPPLLDLVNYVDYIVVNSWAGNWDWPRNNFWAGRDRDPLTTTGFHFFNWDGENTLGNNRSRSPLNKDVFDPSTQPGIEFGQDGSNQPLENAGRPHSLLKANAEYRQLFADRVHRLFFNDGALMPDNLIERFAAISDGVEQAMIGESARWGDMQAHRSPAPNSAISPADWINERNWIFGLPNTRGGDPYLPNRSAVVLGQLAGYGLYSAVVAPAFNQHGGQVPQGFDVTVTAPAGTIWYTTDGSDPRALGGAVSGSAIQYTGTPVDVPAGLTLKARALSGGSWSALNEATFSVAVPANAMNLRIVELNYHPAAHAGVDDEEDLEFIELLNPSQQIVSLDGVTIAQFATTPYAFPNGLVLAPGERIVVAREPSVFQSVYGMGVNLVPTGYASANLSNGGERIVLVGPTGQPLQDITYSDSGQWPTAADGGGRSLEIINPLGAPWSPANWRASYLVDGSPGTSGVKTGDFDGDQDVDGADFLAWQRGLGTAAPHAAPTHGDADADLDVDGADLLLWADHFGDAPASAAAASIAAPSPDAPAALLAADAWILLSDATTARANGLPAARPRRNESGFATVIPWRMGVSTHGDPRASWRGSCLRVPATAAETAAADAAFAEPWAWKLDAGLPERSPGRGVAIAPKI